MGINSLFTEQNSIDIFSESLSSLFDNKDQEDVINGILKDVLNLHHASRAYIFLYDFENGVQHYQYEVCAENVVPQIDIIGTIPLNDSLYFNKYIFEREPIVINNIEDIRFMAKSEYEILKQQDIKSLIVVPIIHRNKILGYIGVDIVDKIKIWTEQDITLLFLLSKLVVVSVAASVNTRESNQHKKALISNSNSILKVLGSLYYYIPIGIELYD